MERSKKVKVKNVIDDLPDHFLESVLSRLTLAEAARTSLLCRRWRNLWKSITCLNFDASTVLPVESVDEREDWYISWVNKVIESHKAEEFIVEDFRIHYWLSSRCESVLKRWVDFAVTKQAKSIHVNLTGYKPVIMHLEQACNLHKSQCCRALAALRRHTSLETLSLRCVNVDRELIEAVLLNCLQLRDLCIAYAENMYNLRVSGSGARLRRLEVTHNWYNVFSEIHAPELETLVYNAEGFNPSKVHLPKLVSLSIHVTENPLQILDVLRPFGTQIPSGLRYLHVGVEEINMLNLKSLPRFVNVKALSLNVNRSDNSCKTLIHLVKACPSVELLKIHIPVVDDMSDESEESEESEESDDLDESFLEAVPKCPRLEYLKEMDLVVFEEEVLDWGLIKHVIKNSPCLEKVQINTSNAYGTMIYVKMKAISLRSHLPFGARLIICSRYPIS